MGTFQQDHPTSEQRSHGNFSAREDIDSAESAFLARRVRELEAELEAAHAHARNRSEEKQALDTVLAQLREANEHLVLATFNAEYLREDAEAVNRRQNEFLAMLAHELRNPLSPISMAASLLGNLPDATPQLVNLSRVIGRQVGHMARLLDDLLDAARISSGKITLAREPLPLDELVQHAVETMQPRIHERRQQLSVDVPRGQIVVDGDRVRLTQVFTNLLANASKYTADGGVLRIAASTDGDDAVVHVEDNGIGMAPEVVPHIFDLFTQGPRSLARSEGGLGIGLNVVRNLLAMHGASVRAESGGPGQGSRFTVRLPASRGAVETCAVSATGSARAGARRRILLVEDNVDACEMLAAFLATDGHEVHGVHDGHAGLAAALARPWDVIICDIGLPGLDGFDVMRGVRTAGRVGTFGIALSGYGQDGDRARGLAVGFDHYLIKPVEAGELRSLIAALPEQRMPSPGA